MILIFAPTAKNCEPPVGIAKLAGALRFHDIPVTVVDLNIEGFYSLYHKETTAEDTWTKKALKQRATTIALLTSPRGYENRDRYRSAITDVTRVLKHQSAPFDTVVSPANYQSNTLSPVRSADLIHAASHYRENIFYPLFKQTFDTLLKDPDSTETVGFSLVYMNQALCTFAMIGYLREHYKKVTIILGGGLITSWLRKPDWENPFGSLIDHIIAGEGEEPLLRKHGIESPEEHYLPDYSCFDLDRYLAPGFILPFCTASGCYWRKCTFCPELAEQNDYCPIPAGHAVEQLQILCDTYNPVLVHIVDNAVSPAFMKALTIQGFDTPWYGFTRISEHLADPAFCRALYENGCRMLNLGIESGDGAVLSAMNKGADPELASRVLRTVKAAGIKTYVYLLFGTPAETEAAAYETMNFVVDHHDCIDFLNLAIFNLPYFAAQAETLVTDLFYEGDLSLYSEFRHPHGWNRDRIRRFLGKTFKKHPAIKKIVNAIPPVYNANHAAFF